MEIYKSVFGKYEVSNYGNVRNSRTGKMLKLITDRYGYNIVCLFECGRRYYPKVHRLVALAFIENPSDKPFIDHIDGNKTNNVVSNLRWVTPKENTHNPITLEKIKKHCKPPAPTTRAVFCVETGEQYQSVREAAEITGVDSSSITKCCKGKRKICGGFHWRYA